MPFAAPVTKATLPLTSFMAVLRKQRWKLYLGIGTPHAFWHDDHSQARMCEASQMVAIVPPNNRLKSTGPSFGAVCIVTPFWKARPCGSLDFMGPNARKGPAEAGEIPPLPACWGKPIGCS